MQAIQNQNENVGEEITKMSIDSKPIQGGDQRDSQTAKNNARKGSKHISIHDNTTFLYETQP